VGFDGSERIGWMAVAVRSRTATEKVFIEFLEPVLVSVTTKMGWACDSWIPCDMRDVTVEICRGPELAVSASVTAVSRVTEIPLQQM
jgi:hypothetical protein